MVHRGTRSKTAQQRRKLRQYVFSMSYRDSILAETVSMVKVPMLVTYFEHTSEGVVEHQDIVDWVAQGEVILDSRGRGSLQT